MFQFFNFFRYLWILTNCTVLVTVLMSCKPRDIDLHSYHPDHSAPTVPPQNPEFIPTAPAKLWSAASTWPNGRLPLEGESVTIPSGQEIILDLSPPDLGGITINGKLSFARQNLNLTARWIMVHGGFFEIGTEASPYIHRATITLNGSESEDIHGMGSRGIMVMGGALDFHGTSPQPVWTKLSQTAAANASSLTVLNSTNWQNGDEIVIAPTDFYRIGETEKLTLQSAAGVNLSLTTPLLRSKWGALQYIQNNPTQGVTLTPTTAVTSKVLDQRGEVGNLTRNIVIRSPSDSAWTMRGFGAQIAIMNPGFARVEGVQIQNGGQSGILGRYPFHWHALSYDRITGLLVGDATGQYFRNSVVSGSSQRCVVIHGTNAVTVKDNICYDIRGHAIFLEDAVERRNLIEGNLVLRVRNPAPGRFLQLHENGSSGYWLTNPDNTVRGNVAADCQGHGFWLAYPENTLGLHKAVQLRPVNVRFGVFNNNVTHSNRGFGLMFDEVPINDAGNVGALKYWPTTDGQQSWNLAPFEINGLVVYKQERVNTGFAGEGAIWNRAQDITMKDFTVSDYNGAAFSGGSVCDLTQALVVGRTLNGANHNQVTESRGMATYHSHCRIFDNILVNLPAVAGKASGAYETNDYYIDGVEKGLVRNTGNLMINTHPGYREESPNTRPVGVTRENWSLSGAIWDPEGLFGAAGNYWVYDRPFFTYGASCAPVTVPMHGNDLSCVGPYYGIYLTQINRQEYTHTPISYVRNENSQEWFIDDGNCTGQLGHMRSTAFVKDGSYTMTFPAGRGTDFRNTCPNPAQLAADTPAPAQLVLTVSNLLSGSDGFVMAVEYSGATTPTIYQTSWQSFREIPNSSSWSRWKGGFSDWQTYFRGEYWRPILPASSLSDFNNVSNTGELYYQDRGSNLIWLKVRRRGIASPTFIPYSREELYQNIHFILDNTL